MYGFNGQEKDDEVKGAGNSVNYIARIYDPRLGRFSSVDPLTAKFPMLTPYQFASNTPIWGVDIDGEEVRIYTESGNFLRANVGHTFITVGSADDLIVYTYGRYDDVNKNKGPLNPTNPKGEGVLIKLTGRDAQAFVSDHINNLGGRAFEITDIDREGESRVKSFFDNKFNSSNELPDREGGKYHKDPRARVVDQYDLLCNNCTTVSVGGIKMGDTGAFKEEFEYIAPPKSGYGVPMKINKSFTTPLGLERDLKNKSAQDGIPVRDVTDELKSDKN